MLHLSATKVTLNMATSEFDSPAAKLVDIQNLIAGLAGIQVDGSGLSCVPVVYLERVRALCVPATN